MNYFGYVINNIGVVEERERKEKGREKHYSFDDVFLLPFTIFLSSMCSTIWFATFSKEALPFEVALANCAPETIRMIIVVERLHPTVTGCNW